MERHLDFDTIIERKGTDCLKYDFAKEMRKEENLIPLWVADMDLKVSSYICDAIKQQAEHGIYGYSDSKEDYFQAVADWMMKHHKWKIEKEWLIKTPGVVFALAMSVKAFTDMGDSVMICRPVYHPFGKVITDNKRRLVDCSLELKEDGRYYINFEEMERIIREENVKLFFLCSPHNPSGRVWNKEELLQIARLCLKYHVIVVSDEIHADLVFKGKHHVFSTVDSAIKHQCIICTAPSKTFNIAGLQVSNIFIENKELRIKFLKQMQACGISEINAAGLAAAKAAYQYGEVWYQNMMEYLQGNIKYVKDFIDNKIPQLKVIEQEASYLLWIDFRELGLKEEELTELIEKKAGLWLSSGEIFGSHGAGFQRMNIACPRSRLKEAMEKLEKSVE